MYRRGTRSKVIEQIGIRVTPETKQKAIEIYHMGKALGKWRNWEEAMRIMLRLAEMYLDEKIVLRERVAL